MTWSERKPEPRDVAVPDVWPFPRDLKCVLGDCGLLFCCQQAGRCLAAVPGDPGPVEDALL